MEPDHNDLHIEKIKLEIAELKRPYHARPTFWISLIGVIIALVGVFAQGYLSSINSAKAELEVNRARQELAQIEKKDAELRQKAQAWQKRIDTAELEVSTARQELAQIEKANLELSQEALTWQERINTLEQTIEGLRKTESNLLEFFSTVTSGEKIHLLDRNVDWDIVKKQIIKMPAGKRKQALLIALLYGWKDIPFTLSGHTLSEGFDSPGFLKRVLDDVGVKLKTLPNTRPSDSIMSQLAQTNAPRSGDLVFYRGKIGSFGFILLYVGNESKPHVGIGTLQKKIPLVVTGLNNINTTDYPFIGYFRVHYPDEQP